MARLEDMTEDEQDRLRDEIAMAALSGMYASPHYAFTDTTFIEDAVQAYKIADAMLDVRDRKPVPQGRDCEGASDAE